MQKQANSAKLRMETLENRNLMAGDIAVHVSGGTLVVAGDQADNGVELTSTAIPGQFIVTGIAAGGEPTTINGDSTPLVVDGVDRHVRIRMGDGDDRLHASHLDIDGAMVVRMGRGDDVVKIGEVEADAALVDIARGLYVRLGSGDDMVGIGNTATRWIHVHSGTGDDVVAIRDSVASRSMHVHGGTGDDDIRINNVRTRRLRIRSGTDNDTVRIVDSQALWATVHLGADDDALTVEGSRFRRAALFGSQGTDTLVTDLALEEIFVRGFENV